MRSVLSVSLPENLSSELDAFAKKTGRNKSDIVKDSVSLYLWEARFRNGRKSLSLKAKKAGLVTEEDVFRAVSCRWFLTRMCWCPPLLPKGSARNCWGGPSLKGCQQR